MVFIRSANLPMEIRGFVMPDNEGNYNIYINDKLSEERKEKTIEHELQHIKNQDCYSNEQVSILEKRII